MIDKDISKLTTEKYVYLTTSGRKTGKRHTVELWFAVAAGKVYLSHEGDFTDWMKNILKDDNVNFKIHDVSFKGKARIVKKGEIFEIGKHALYRKYYGEASKGVIDDWFSESNVIAISLSG
ncbi:MAG: hypothetical protein QG670_809 [Thermoproteota archaeon]|nr:hypothetical protein [Thermoproteota archaeon]